MSTMVFSFDFNTKALTFNDEEVFKLPEKLKCCWSGSEIMSITSYASLFSQRLGKHTEYFVEHCSNEATYFQQFINHVGQFPPLDTAAIQYVSGYPLLRLDFPFELPNSSNSTYEQQLFINLIFFQGLHLFFSDFSAFPKEEFSFALFYVTWQWYHIAKSMLMVKCLPKSVEKKTEFSNTVSPQNTPNSALNIPEKECLDDLKQPYPLYQNRLINENFRLAYIALNHLVEDPTYLMMIQQLPINRMQEHDQSTILENTYKYIHAEAEDLQSRTDFSEIIGSPPTKDMPLTIHPKFVEHPIMIKNLISQHLLPAYDLETAFQLGKLLQKKQDELKKQKAKAKTPKTGRCREKWNNFCKSIKKFFTSLNFNLLLTILILIVLPVGGTHIYKHCNFLSADLECKAFCISLAQLIILGFYFYIRVLRPYKSLLIHLLLPRLMAGVMVGYMAFVLQGDAYFIPNYIFGIANPFLRYTLAKCFFLACVILGYFYLRADTSQFTRGKKKSIPRKRALLTLLFAMTISVAMGLLAVVFLTNPKISQPHLTVLGPFGWFDIHLMFFYVPLSFLTGLVSQFIFEEKSLTAPTWSAESMN